MQALSIIFTFAIIYFWWLFNLLVILIIFISWFIRHCRNILQLFIVKFINKAFSITILKQIVKCLFAIIK